VPEYESFAAAERALNEFAGWETERGIRPMTPKERQDAQRLLKDRRADVIERGKQGITLERKGVREIGDTLVSRYNAAETLLDELEESVEDGTVSVKDLELAMADAARLQNELGKLTDSHYVSAERVAKEQNPEAVMRDLYRRYPALGRHGRTSPWTFGW
jgi:hypothetical protein